MCDVCKRVLVQQGAAAGAVAAAAAGAGGGVPQKDVTEAAKGAVQTLQVGEVVWASVERIVWVQVQWFISGSRVLHLRSALHPPTPLLSAPHRRGRAKRSGPP